MELSVSQMLHFDQPKQYLCFCYDCSL